MATYYLGVDLAKDVFQLCGLSENRHVVFKRRVRRDRLLIEIAQLPPCTVGVEACTGAFSTGSVSSSG